MKDNIKEGDKLWTTVVTTESVLDSTRVYRFSWNSEGILIGVYNDLTLGLSDNKMLGVDDSYKHGEELVCKEGELLGVSDRDVEDSTEVNMLGYNVCYYE